MKEEKWLDKNARSLKGKVVAITGSTGGLGKEIVFKLAYLGASLILLDRNQQKALALEEEVLAKYPNVKIRRFQIELSDVLSVKKVCQSLQNERLDGLILNAGVYHIPKEKSGLGYDKLFQTNFISQYFLVKQLLPNLEKSGGKVVAVGSKAYSYNKTDFEDIDFSKNSTPRYVYGNSKRFLMFSLIELFKKQTKASLSIVHPGISYTGIMANYPKWVYKMIALPMKLIFPSPKKASRCVVKGLFDTTQNATWIGPRFANIWGNPRKKRLTSFGQQESEKIFEISEKIYERMEKF